VNERTIAWMVDWCRRGSKDRDGGGGGGYDGTEDGDGNREDETRNWDVGV
jgi:hypothetical protein